MRTKFLIVFLFFFGYTNCFGQNGLRNEWYIGLRNYKVKFAASLPQVKYLSVSDTIPHIVRGNSNICDSNGHLLLATDGIKLYDSNGKFIDGGGGNINNDTIVEYDGYDTAYPNTSIILPKSSNEYYVFIATMSDEKYKKYYNQGDTFDFDQIRYSIVDMSANNGKGKITVHNKLLLQADDTPWINKSNFTACRHANGRDWWLLKPSARMRQVMYKFLVTPDSIYSFKENRPLLFNIWAYDNRGQSAFSKDGSLYAECNQYGPHTLYDFNRCSGELTFKRMIDLKPYKDTFGNSISFGPTWSGLCFSPNNRFLYTCDFFNVYQIDTWEINDSLAIKRVSKDTNSNPSPFGHANYHAMQLTPTGQIYLGNRHGISSEINAIMKPDQYEDLCEFEFGYLKINLSNNPYFNTSTDPPNMPFYELGSLKGSPCDTLNPTIPPPPLINTVIKIYPNPSRDNLTIELPTDTKKCELVVYDLIGNVVLDRTINGIMNDKVEISLYHLSQSLYLIKVIAKGERYLGKFVKE